MRFKKFLLVKSDVFVEEISGIELLDLFEKKSYKSIHKLKLKNIFGKPTNRLKPCETLPEFCKRMNIIKNPMWENPKLKINEQK